MNFTLNTSSERPRRYRRSWALATAIALAAMIAVSLWGSGYAHRFYFDEASARGNNTLRLAVAVLRGHMARYQSLPTVIADFEIIQELAQNPGDRDLVDSANRYLKQINTQFESSDIYVMLDEGTTIAASNYDTEAPFVGENFRYRPYFYDAIDGGEGRFFALGTTSLKRGYYFGAPVWVNGVARAVVAVKIDVESIEETWQSSDYEIVVTDPEGIIFMSSNPGWLYNSLQPLTPDRLARTAATRRYANAQLQELPMTDTGNDRHQLFNIEQGAGSQELLVVSENMSEADWTVKVLQNTASARSQAVTTIIVALLIIAMTALAVSIFLQRRARLRERLDMQREAQELLEHRVAERTEELASVNRQLEDEVAERRATEATLRQTQSDLIQAGKLAALGQMSAALSHEFNQPLAAARNYADNALVLIERERFSDAGENVSRISSLIDRMASISRHLRNFARKPTQKLTTVGLSDVLNDTLEIIDWRLRASDAVLDIDLGPTPVHVRGGPVRLQQVLVNIISNAVDAVEECEDRTISISAAIEGAKVILSIRDRGPGVSAALSERIFDPFFSTKGVGKGLGLGLSISYNIIKDFGGELRVANHPEGGAVFTIELEAAMALERDQSVEAAQ